jgi:hypothetical protein
MKKIALFLHILFFYACILHAQIKQEEMFGAWKYHDIEVAANTDAAGKAMLQQYVADMFMMLASDKNYQLTSMGKKEEGTWILEDKKLKLKSNKGRETVFLVELLATKQLKITTYPLDESPFYIILQKEAEAPTSIKLETAKLKGIAIEKEQIIKKWYYVKTMQTNSAQNNRNELVDKTLQGLFFDFRQDGTFTTKVVGLEEKGTWVLSADKTEIILQVENESKAYWKVLKLTKTELILNKGDVEKPWVFSSIAPK